jgi:hypothetical protein
VQKRVSLTKSQRSSGVGAELLALCQAVTDDGYLSKDEVVELRRWLKDNRDGDLPAIAFLSETVERIIADHRITREERHELYRAIELVLPPDARKEAVDARREAESEREYRERLERESNGRAERTAAVRERRPRSAREAASRPPKPKTKREPTESVSPLATSKFMVAGVHHEGRAAVIEQFADEGDPIYLARDTASPLSKNAIEVRLANGFVIGFVPEEDAEVLAPLLDDGCPHQAHIKTIVEGGRAPVPVIVSRIYEPDAEIDDATFPDDVPPRAVPETSIVRAAWHSQVGWAVLLGVLGLIVAVAYFNFFNR